MPLSETSAPASLGARRACAFTLGAVDLTGSARHRQLWFPAAVPVPDGDAPDDLPAGGFASPMGYWFHPVAHPGEVGEGFSVTVRDPSEGTATPGARTGPGGRRGRARQTVSLPAAQPGAGELTLTIGDDGSSEVSATPAAWEALSEPVLLIAAQYARLSVIDRTLSAMDDGVRRDQGHAALPGARSWIHQHQMLTRAGAFGDLVYDWTHFAGLYTDPAQYCSSSATVEAYLVLAGALNLAGWCERLEKTVEEIETFYETLIDKLFHYKLFAFGMLVEIVIVILIAAAYFR